MGSKFDAASIQPFFKKRSRVCQRAAPGNIHEYEVQKPKKACAFVAIASNKNGPLKV